MEGGRAVGGPSVGARGAGSYRTYPTCLHECEESSSAGFLISRPLDQSPSAHHRQTAGARRCELDCRARAIGADRRGELTAKNVLEPHLVYRRQPEHSKWSEFAPPSGQVTVVEGRRATDHPHTQWSIGVVCLRPAGYRRHSDATGRMRSYCLFYNLRGCLSMRETRSTSA